VNILQSANVTEQRTLEKVELRSDNFMTIINVEENFFVTSFCSLWHQLLCHSLQRLELYSATFSC